MHLELVLPINLISKKLRSMTSFTLLSMPSLFPLIEPTSKGGGQGQSCYRFFETEAKYLSHRLIKKKRIAQLILGKPGKNQYKQPKRGLLTMTTQLVTHNNRSSPHLHNTKKT